MILGAIITGIVGIVCNYIGYLIAKKDRITLLHDYHYKNVKEENKKAFCITVGSGIITIGNSLLVTAVILAFTESAWSFIASGVGFILGGILLVRADRKYNR